MNQESTSNTLYKAVDALITSILGEADSSNGHYSLDRGNLQAFAYKVVEVHQVLRCNTVIQKAYGAFQTHPPITTPLWEIRHDEHIEAGSWNGRPEQSKTHETYKSWDDFASYHTLDPSVILYRWDWHAPRKDDNEEDSPIVWKHDEYYRESTVKLYFINQGKAWNFSVAIDVCRKDEPAIREWLAQRFRYMAKLWEPFINGANSK